LIVRRLQQEMPLSTMASFPKWFRRNLLPLALAGTAMEVAAQELPHPRGDGFAVVHGCVVGGKPTEPIAGAQIRADTTRYQAATLGNGCYRLLVRAPRTVRIRVSRLGFHTYTTDPVALRPHQVIVRNFHLKSSAYIKAGSSWIGG
jgi:hypothetical protein